MSVMPDDFDGDRVKLALKLDLSAEDIALIQSLSETDLVVLAGMKAVMARKPRKDKGESRPKKPVPSVNLWSRKSGNSSLDIGASVDLLPLESPEPNP